MLKIQIESPLVNITFQDEHVFTGGHTRHTLPEGGTLNKLIDKLKDTCSQIIVDHIRAKRYGVIDLTKMDIPKDINEITVKLHEEN